MSVPKLLLLAGVLIGLSSGNVRADVVTMTASLDSSQEVPPNASTAIGSALITIDNVTNFLTWDINWSGLSGPATGMHFHAAPVGVNGNVVVNIGLISGLTSPSIGSTTITAPQTADLLNEGWYINIHTTANPGGEIRGQVRAIPEPGALVVLGAAALLGGILLRRRRVA